MPEILLAKCVMLDKYKSMLTNVIILKCMRFLAKFKQPFASLSSDDRSLTLFIAEIMVARFFLDCFRKNVKVH